MSQGLYSQALTKETDGQGCLTSGLVSRRSFSSRGSVKVKALGGPIKKPGTRLASEYRSHSRPVVTGKCTCGGRIVKGDHFERCDRCGWEDRPQLQSVENARSKARARKRFMKSLREVD